MEDEGKRQWLSRQRGRLATANLVNPIGTQESMVERLYGIPIAPPNTYWPQQLPTFHWGATHTGWGSVVYGDGSGFDGDLPELLRCGWAVVQLDANLWPVRALFGPLPGPLQSVGRAERWALLQAVLHCKGMECYVADLFSLVEEGKEWHARHASAKGKHAAIWQKVFEAQEQREEQVPQFRWTPAHKTMEDVLAGRLPLADWIGNQWADHFAKEGARFHRVAASHVQECSNYVERMRNRAKFMAWTLAKISASKRWDEVDTSGAKVKMPKNEDNVKQHDVIFEEHAYVWLPAGGVRCIRCNRTARTAATKRQLQARPCVATPLSQLRAAAATLRDQGKKVLQDALMAPTASPAVEIALQAAERIEAEGPVRKRKQEEQKMPPRAVAPRLAQPQPTTSQEEQQRATSSRHNSEWAAEEEAAEFLFQDTPGEPCQQAEGQQASSARETLAVEVAAPARWQEEGQQAAGSTGPLLQEPLPEPALQEATQCRMPDGGAAGGKRRRIRYKTCLPTTTAGAGEGPGQPEAGGREGGGDGEAPAQPATATAGGGDDPGPPAAEDRCADALGEPAALSPPAAPPSEPAQTHTEMRAESGLRCLAGTASGHQLQTVAQFVFCRVCGAYASRGARRLREECSGPLCPQGSQRDTKRARCRDRLLEARHPTTNVPL